MKNTIFLFTVAVICAIATDDLHAQTFSISGTLSFPPGIVSSQSAVTYRIETDPLGTLESNGETLTSSTTVTIPRLTRSTSYQISLDALDGSLDPITLRFECVTGCSSVALTSVGYWSEDDGVVGESDATLYSPDDDLTVDITLERADVFSGTLKLPDNITASGEEELQVLLRASSFFDTAAFAQTIVAEEGETEWPFFIGVPRIDTVGGWNLELTCSSCDENIPTDIHYPTTASGDPMSLAAADDFFFRKFVSFSNMQMTFISTAKSNSGAVVAGSISVLLLDDD